MKKLIIIGNGFDLAHGLKTSSSDFIRDYLDKVWDDLAKKGFYKDLLISLKRGGQSYYNFNNFAHECDGYNLTQQFINLNSGQLHEFDPDFKIKYSNYLLKKLLKEDLRWVDIEKLFQDLILEHKDNEESVKQINSELDYLKELLSSYLDKECKKGFKEIKKYNGLFSSGNYQNTMFLNFNYTDTIDGYLNYFNETIKNSNDDISRKVSLNNIHGNIKKSSKDSLIFGMGDEFHEEYKTLNKYTYLKTLKAHDKSILYMKSKEYSKLKDFLAINSLKWRHQSDGSAFDIEIYGHSCGTSDRTLFKYLFQHAKCNKITVFHYKNMENYTQNIVDISRHFDDPQLFRDRVQPFDPNNEMPQSPN